MADGNNACTAVPAGRHKRYGVMDGERLLIFDTKAQAETARAAIKSRVELERRPSRRIKAREIPAPHETISIPTARKMAVEQARAPQLQELLATRNYDHVSRLYQVMKASEETHRRGKEEEEFATQLVRHRRALWTDAVLQIRMLLKELK